MTKQIQPDLAPGHEPAAGAPPAKPRAGALQPLRTYFLTGVIITAPIGITVYIAVGFITFVDRHVTPLIPEVYQPRHYLPFSVPGFGLVLVLVGLTLVGFLAANILGRQLVRLGERLVGRMPVVRNIYGALKQIFETVLTPSSSSFRQVVMIEYPRRGVWALAFLANERSGEPGQRIGVECITLYLPTAVNPTSGYLLFVPRADAIFLEMSVEDAMKMILSGGVVVPPVLALPLALPPAARATLSQPEDT